MVLHMMLFAHTARVTRSNPFLPCPTSLAYSSCQTVDKADLPWIYHSKQSHGEYQRSPAKAVPSVALVGVTGGL